MAFILLLPLKPESAPIRALGPLRSFRPLGFLELHRPFGAIELAPVPAVNPLKARALQLAELEAVGLRDLAPAHPARTLLQDARQGERRAGLRRDGSAVERGLDLVRRRLVDAVACE